MVVLLLPCVISDTVRHWAIAWTRTQCRMRRVHCHAHCRVIHELRKGVWQSCAAAHVFVTSCNARRRQMGGLFAAKGVAGGKDHYARPRRVRRAMQIEPGV